MAKSVSAKRAGAPSAKVKDVISRLRSNVHQGWLDAAKSKLMSIVPVRERVVERYLLKRVREVGGECYKFKSPGRRGVPDRMVVFPLNHVFFVETKRPGKKATAQQMREHGRMTKLGLTVLVINNKIDVDFFVAPWA